MKQTLSSLLGTLFLSSGLLAQSVWLENPAGITYSLGPHFINSIDLDHGDFDGDGNEDVVLVHLAEGKASVEIYRNSGTSLFMLQESRDLVQSTATAVKVADVDGDNDDDIILTNFKGHNHIY